MGGAASCRWPALATPPGTPAHSPAASPAAPGLPAVGTAVRRAVVAASFVFTKQPARIRQVGVHSLPGWQRGCACGGWCQPRGRLQAAARRARAARRPPLRGGACVGPGVSLPTPPPAAPVNRRCFAPAVPSCRCWDRCMCPPRTSTTTWCGPSPCPPSTPTRPRCAGQAPPTRGGRAARRWERLGRGPAPGRAPGLPPLQRLPPAMPPRALLQRTPTLAAHAPPPSPPPARSSTASSLPARNQQASVPSTPYRLDSSPTPHLAGLLPHHHGAGRAHEPPAGRAARQHAALPAVGGEGARAARTPCLCAACLPLGSGARWLGAAAAAGAAGRLPRFPDGLAWPPLRPTPSSPDACLLLLLPHRPCRTRGACPPAPTRSSATTPPPPAPTSTAASEWPPWCCAAGLRRRLAGGSRREGGGPRPAAPCGRPPMPDLCPPPLLVAISLPSPLTQLPPRRHPRGGQLPAAGLAAEPAAADRVRARPSDPPTARPTRPQAGSVLMGARAPDSNARHRTVHASSPPPSLQF